MAKSIVARSAVRKHHDSLPTLPPTPGAWPTIKLVSACEQIIDSWGNLPTTMTLEIADEYRQRAAAIEKYLRTAEHKGIASCATRLLESAVGRALPEAEEGKPRKGYLTHESSSIHYKDRQRFRRMGRYLPVWLARATQKKSLSRREVLKLIDWHLRPKAKGEGTATVERAMALDWLKHQPDGDLLLTDPPYSTDIENIQTFSRWLPTAIRHLKPTARAFVFIGAYADEFAAYFSQSLPTGWTWSVPHAWVYRNAIGPTPDQDFIRNWQCILSASGPSALPLASDRITELLAGFVENAPDARQDVKHHRWEKPLPLVQRLIRLTTAADQIVLDPFCGSGTTQLAAKAEGRNGRGCDSDQKAVAKAIERGCDAA